MATQIGELQLKISANNAEFNQGLMELEDNVSKFSKKAEEDISNFAEDSIESFDRVISKMDAIGNAVLSTIDTITELSNIGKNNLGKILQGVGGIGQDIGSLLLSAPPPLNWVGGVLKGAGLFFKLFGRIKDSFKTRQDIQEEQWKENAARDKQLALEKEQLKFEQKRLKEAEKLAQLEKDKLDQLEKEKKELEEILIQRTKLLFEERSTGSNVQQRLAAFNESITSILRNQGLSDKEIKAFLNALPRFQSGGISKGGLSILEPEEFVFNQKASKELGIDFLSKLQSLATSGLMNKTIQSQQLVSQPVININMKINISSGDKEEIEKQIINPLSTKLKDTINTMFRENVINPKLGGLE